MANIQVWALRKSSDKSLIAVSYNAFTDIQAGREQVEVTIPEEDMQIFPTKYKFNSSTGELEFNAPFWYHLEVSDDAGVHNPVNDFPQIDVGGTAYCTISLQKKDGDDIDQSAAGDNNRVYVSATGGDAYPADSGGTPITYVDLVNGAASFRVYSATQVGTTMVSLLIEEIDDGGFGIETV